MRTGSTKSTDRRARSKALRHHLKHTFPDYSARCLKIRTKDMRIEPLVLNTAQRFLHERVEDQKRRKGKVRILLLKGRQQGCSTYVEGRYYWLTTHQRGARSFILTHEDEATRNLFEMAERFHEHCPQKFRPHAGTANAKELHFDRLDSGYRVATAGKKGVGRSATIQFFHGSEVAFWPNAETHMAGAIQAVPDLPGTEIILESTSGGPDGVFYQLWEDATHGIGDYEAIFIPWFWQDEYRAESQGFTPTAEELALAKEYGLDHAQLAWRRAKIVELRGVHMFRREYPNTPDEAFRAEMPGALWTRALLDQTRVASYPEPLARIVVAVDPATTDDEKSSSLCGIVVCAKGRNGHGYVLADHSDTYSPRQWATTAIQLYRTWKADRIVAETNQGGQMVEHTLRTVDSAVSYRGVHASRAKQARAEPVAAKHEQGEIHLVGHHPKLEDQLCTWVPGNDSPDRLDALVWGMTDLFPNLQTLDALAPLTGLVRESYWRS